MNRRCLLSATAGLALMLAGIFVPLMKHSVDSGLAGNARTALTSRDVSGVTVRSDWASLTLRGHASARTPALAAVHRMRDIGAVNTVTYLCTDGTACAAPARAPKAASPETPSPKTASPKASPAPSRPAPSSSAPAAPAAPAGTSAPDRMGTRIRQALGKDGVTFATGSTSLTPEAAASLRHVAAMLAAEPSLTVAISGFTDNSGSASLNRSLSLARANATRDYLAAHGVSARRLKTAGFGEEHPIASNSTPAGRAANRRIEFTVSGS